MPVKSSKTASTTTPRKRRTRKTSTTRTAKAVAKTDKVIKEVQAVLDAPKVKVTKVKPVSKIRTLKTVKRPSTARLITPTRYWSDIKTRWEIHNYEITMLVSDLTKGLKYVRQFTNLPLNPRKGVFYWYYIKVITKGALMQLRQIANNMTQLDLADGTSVLFSYRTPVATLTDNGYYRTSKHWSVTTTRHINKWLGGVLAKDQPQAYFDQFLTLC